MRLITTTIFLFIVLSASSQSKSHDSAELNLLRALNINFPDSLNSAGRSGAVAVMLDTSLKKKFKIVTQPNNPFNAIVIQSLERLANKFIQPPLHGFILLFIFENSIVRDSKVDTNNFSELVQLLLKNK